MITLVIAVFSIHHAKILYLLGPTRKSNGEKNVNLVHENQPISDMWRQKNMKVNFFQKQAIHISYG